MAENSMSNPLDDLIARLEKATEADQQSVMLDVIAFAYKSKWIAAIAYNRALEWILLGAYESAALILVPEGWSWTVKAYRDCAPPNDTAHAVVSRVAWEKRGDEAEFYKSSNPAIALCIAALKAMQTARTTEQPSDENA